VPQVLEKPGQQLLGDLVVHLPQAGHGGLRPGHVEGALQAIDSLAAGHLAQPRFARRQHGQLQLLQRQAGDHFGHQGRAN
jgi:hypothetical protein